MAEVRCVCTVCDGLTPHNFLCDGCGAIAFCSKKHADKYWQAFHKHECARCKLQMANKQVQLPVIISHSLREKCLWHRSMSCLCLARQKQFVWLVRVKPEVLEISFIFFNTATDISFRGTYLLVQMGIAGLECFETICNREASNIDYSQDIQN